jgi:hypothetical protein
MVGGERESETVIGIMEECLKHVNTMSIWNQEFGKLLATLTHWDVEMMNQHMMKEWGSTEGPDFVNICKLFIIKRITMGADEQGAMINKVIRGLLMPSIGMRAVDLIIKEGEKEIIPNTWLVGQHFQCDRDVTVHTQTVFSLLRKYADAFGLGPHVKFSTQLGENMRIIPVREIHSVNTGWGVSESEIGLFQNWIIMRIQTFSASIKVSPQEFQLSNASAGTIAQIEHIIGICSSQVDVKLSRAKETIDLELQESLRQEQLEQRDFVNGLSDQVRDLAFQASAHNLNISNELIERRFQEQNMQVRHMAEQVERLKTAGEMSDTGERLDSELMQNLQTDMNSLRESLEGQRTESARATAIIAQQGEIIQQLRKQENQAEMIETTKRSLQRDLPDMVKELIPQTSVTATRMEELEVKMAALLKENRELRALDNHQREESGARDRKQDSTLEEMRKRLQEIQLSQAHAPKLDDMFEEIRREQKAATRSVISQVNNTMSDQRTAMENVTKSMVSLRDDYEKMMEDFEDKQELRDQAQAEKDKAREDKEASEREQQKTRTSQVEAQQTEMLGMLSSVIENQSLAEKEREQTREITKALLKKNTEETREQVAVVSASLEEKVKSLGTLLQANRETDNEEHRKALTLMNLDTQAKVIITVKDQVAAVSKELAETQAVWSSRAQQDMQAMIQSAREGWVSKDQMAQVVSEAVEKQSRRREQARVCSVTQTHQSRARSLRGKEIHG